MGLIAEYEISFSRLPLVDVAASLPAVTLSVDVGQPNQGGLPPFVVRASGGSKEDVEDSFVESGFVADFALLGRTEETLRYQVIPTRSMVEQLGDHVDDIDELRALAGNESIVESVEVTAAGWIQRRWFADRTAFDEYRRFWQRNGDGFSLQQLKRSDEGRGTDRSGGESVADGLTDRQQEALVTANEMGYFEIPRTATLGDVAAALGISAASASERLRRAQAELVESTVGADGLTHSALKGPQ